MAQSTRVRQARPSRLVKNSEHANKPQPEGSETISPDENAPESASFALDAVERTLQAQGVSGEGVQFAMDSGARAQNLLILQQAVGNRTVQRLVQRQGPKDAGAAGGAPPDPDAALPEDLRTFRTKGPVPADAKGTTINTSV